MSRPGKERLVRVTAERQVQVGQLLELRACRYCGRARCRALVLRAGPAAVVGKHRVGVSDVIEPCRAPRVFDMAPDCQGRPDIQSCYCSAIREGRLYIVDAGLDPDQDQAVDRLMRQAAAMRAERLETERRAQRRWGRADQGGRR